MATHTRSFGILFGLGLGLLIVACSGGGGDNTSGGTVEPTNQTPQTEAQVTSPSSSLQVTASIAAATLGDDCGDSKQGSGFAAGDCAPTPPGEAGKGGCGGSFGCQQSNVQIAFSATAQGSASARIEIVQVTLHDDGGSQLAVLTSSTPKSWTGSSYAAWDQTIAPSAKIKASYDLSAPDWSKVGTRYDTKYRLRVSLRIDGVSILLESTVLNREPAVAT